MSYVDLNSVGTVIDTVTGDTYPMLTNGKPDLSADCHITELCDEWLDALSDDDATALLNVADGLGLPEDQIGCYYL